MVILTIDNSYSKITGLTAVQEKSLRNTLSYTSGNYFSRFGTRRISLLGKKGEFPTGLLGTLHAFLADNKITWNIVEKRFKPSLSPQGKVLEGTPYPWQVNAVKAAERFNRGIISAPTGTGKSMAMALLIARLNVPTLVVVPSLEIKSQLKKVLGNLSNVVIENIDSTYLKTAKDFDCLIIDEGHHSAAKTYRMLNKNVWNKIYYRFFFTATPFRNNEDETLLFESIAGQVIYKLSYMEAIRNNYIVPVESYFIEVPKQTTDAFTYAEVYKDLVVENTPRNVIIANLLTNLHSSQKSTLCLVKEVRHGEILSKLTGLPFINGEDDSSRDFIRQFNNGGKKVVIATTGLMGEGIDTKPCEYVVVAGLGKAKSHLMQQVGRGVRKYENKESAKIIVFCDKSHKFLLKHFKIQRAILKEEYGSICQKLEVT